MNWTIVKNKEEFDHAWQLAKGRYQRALLLGQENLSGSTLRGKMKQYGKKYQESRMNFLERLTENGVSWSEEKGDHGRRLLVIG